MRTSDIAYVPQGHISSTPIPPLNEMTLQEITKRYLTSCIKSHGLVSECQKCKDKCPYGMRATMLAYGTGAFGERAVPYEGSMLQAARMQNELNRQRQITTDALTEERKKIEEKIETTEKEVKPKKRRKGMDPEGWYEEAMKSGDPVKYVMETFGRTKTQAKSKLYNYLYLHPEMKEIHDKYTKKNVSEEKTKEESPVKVETPERVEKPCNTGKTEEKVNTAQPGDIYITRVMEMKLETLMNKQEEYESAIKDYQTKLAKVKEQIETICRTMDIFKTD